MGGLFLNMCVAGLLMNKAWLDHSHLLEPPVGLAKLMRDALRIKAHSQLTLDVSVQQFGLLFIPPLTSEEKQEKAQQQRKINNNKEEQSQQGSKLYQFLVQFRPLCSLSFLTVALFWFCLTGATQALIQYLPVYAGEHGMSETEQSTLIAVKSVCDLLSRIVITVVGDYEKFNKNLFLISMVFIAGVFSFGFSFFSHEVALYFYAGSQGLFAEAMLTFVGFTVVQSIGRQHVGLGIGIIAAIFGLSRMAGSAVIGHLAELMGTYISVLYMAGCLQLIASAVFLLGRIKCEAFTCNTQVNKVI